MFLVTRPQPKADETTEALIAEGLAAFAIPAINIEQLHPPLKSNLNGYDIVIVTSTYTQPFLLMNIKQLIRSHTTIVCVGNSTALMLEQCLSVHNRKCVIQIAEPQNSDGIIASLGPIELNSKTIAIVKGQEGRDIIKEYLTQFSAKTDVYEVYKRTTAFSPTSMNQVDGQAIKCIIVTSIDIAEQIFEHFSHQWLATKIFMVASQRIYDHVQAKSASQVVLASSASTASIVACANQLYLSGVLDDKR